MKSREEFKERLENDNAFKEKFKDVKSTEDVIRIARELDYDITEDDVYYESLDDAALENVSGGGDTTINEMITSLEIIGNGNLYLKF